MTILLTEPSLAVPPHLRLRIGDVLPVTVQVSADGVGYCEAKLTFDSTFFDEVSGLPGLRQLGGGQVAEEIGWQLGAKAETPSSIFGVEGYADGSLPQRVEFQVEVEK